MLLEIQDDLEGLIGDLKQLVQGQVEARTVSTRIGPSSTFWDY